MPAKSQTTAKDGGFSFKIDDLKEALDKLQDYGIKTHNMLWQYSGVKVVQDNFIDNFEWIPKRMRTFRERWFTFPWRPKELFVYEKVPCARGYLVDKALLFANHNMFEHIKSHGMIYNACT